MVVSILGKYNCMEVYNGKRNNVNFEIFQLKPYINEKFLVIRKEHKIVKNFIFTGSRNLKKLTRLIGNPESFSFNIPDIKNKNEFFEENYLNFIVSGILFKEFVQMK